MVGLEAGKKVEVGVEGCTTTATGWQAINRLASENNVSPQVIDPFQSL
jgi:hypothetical protein